MSTAGKANISAANGFKGKDSFQYCGLGVCCAEDGHEGTCAEASGWDEEPMTVANILATNSNPTTKETP